MMKCIYACVSLGLLMGGVASAQSTMSASLSVSPVDKYVSLSHEILRAIEKGNEYLKSKQSPEGYWAQPSYPAMTALAVTAYMRDPAVQGQALPENIKKAYQIILNAQKENGAIYNRGLASYNTSVCMMALMAANNEAYVPAILKARAYLIKQQEHFAPDSPYYGGIGYGGTPSGQGPSAGGPRFSGKPGSGNGGAMLAGGRGGMGGPGRGGMGGPGSGAPIADLSNTSLALEALFYSKKLAQDGKYGKQPELDWKAAEQFINRCQHNPATNKETWVSEDGSQLGGFVYRPAVTRSKDENSPTFEKVEAPKAYGSMTYAGMQSLIYANVDRNDPRVKLALKWMQRSYTLEENPGQGAQGLYYYYQAMAKALSALGIDELNLDDGRKVDWRQDLATRLISIQKGDGSWVNTNNRWWEADPVLVTCYCVLALEQLYYSLPQQ